MVVCVLSEVNRRTREEEEKSEMPLYRICVVATVPLPASSRSAQPLVPFASPDIPDSRSTSTTSLFRPSRPAVNSIARHSMQKVNPQCRSPRSQSISAVFGRVTHTLLLQGTAGFRCDAGMLVAGGTTTPLNAHPGIHSTWCLPCVTPGDWSTGHGACQCLLVP
jgi:hypothetical protein